MAHSAGGSLTVSLQRGKIPSNDCPGYETKQSDVEASVMQEILGMLCIPSLPSFPGPFWAGVVAPDKVQSIGQLC